MAKRKRRAEAKPRSKPPQPQPAPERPKCNPNLIRDMAEGLRTAREKPIRTLAKWMEDELVIPDGPHEGMRFRWDRQPALKLIVDEIDSGRWSEIFGSGPSQSGKTFHFFCAPMLYHLTELGESLVMGVPEARMADDKYKVDLLPVMKASPLLRPLIPKSGPGSQGGVVRDTIRFGNSAALKIMTRSGSDQSKAGFTSRVVVVTEAAGFSRVAETSREANPLKQLQARQKAWDAEDRRLYVEGTVTIEEDLPWSAKAESSNSRIVSQCPWCDEWVLPERENLVGYEDAKSQGEAGRRGYWICPECSSQIDEEMRRGMVARAKLLHQGQWVDEHGNVRGEPPDTRRMFFRYTAWHNMFVSTKTLAEEEWRASRIDPEDAEFEDSEKERCQFVWATPYVPTIIDRAPLQTSMITQRREAFPRGVCPDDTTHLACGVDMGLNTAWYLVLAGRECGQTHIVDYGPLDVLSRDFEVSIAIHMCLSDLRQTLQCGYRLGSSVLAPELTYTDANWETDAVFDVAKEFGARKLKGNWLPIFGRGSGQMMKMYQAPKKLGKGVVEIGNGWNVAVHKTHRMYNAFVNVDYWKYAVHSAFYINEHGGELAPGAMTLFQAPKNQHKQIARHFVNEQQTLEFVPGRGEILKWNRTGANHLLDCAAYARAALDRLGYRAKVPEPGDE